MNNKCYDALFLNSVHHANGTCKTQTLLSILSHRNELSIYWMVSIAPSTPVLWSYAMHFKYIYLLEMQITDNSNYTKCMTEKRTTRTTKFHQTQLKRYKQLKQTHIKKKKNTQINKKFDVKEFHLLLLLMPPDRQRPDQGPLNSSWQRAK
ncbi:UNVERIFIED_CONTAM: hypothetical protein NCL1_33592 [Trichonephila clavipes]